MEWKEDTNRNKLVRQRSKQLITVTYSLGNPELQTCDQGKWLYFSHIIQFLLYGNTSSGYSCPQGSTYHNMTEIQLDFKYVC